MSAAAASPSQPSRIEKSKPNPYPWYSPRFWHGMRWGDWIKLCIAHRFRFSLLRWPMALMIGAVTPFNSVMRVVQRVFFGKRVDAMDVGRPVFIIGHWRSGTTFLHELMNHDKQWATPNSYQCFAPHHFLITEWFMVNFMGWLMPKKRPMDNMEVGFDRPQEDEFALLALGAPTPYLRMAFPNDPPPCMEFLDMQGCAPADLQRFEQALMSFVKTLTFKTGKKLLLKSPPHTGRVEVLARMFPGAKFIHITRNPYSLYSSTLRLWQSLDEVQGLNFPPRQPNLEEYVFECLSRMYSGFEAQRQKLDPAQIYDIRYEDLVKDPVGKLADVYAKLNLSGFDEVRPAVEAHVASQKNYQTNKHQIDEGLKAQIRQRWAPYFERYGYE